MAKMDERTKAELYKINQEKFFLSVIIIAVFLIIKINMQFDILAMLGEITAATVIFIYLVPYFVIRYKYNTIDEMVKSKLYRLSSVFFMLEIISVVLWLIILGFLNKANKLGDDSEVINRSSYWFLSGLSAITLLYGLIRSHNEKFASENATQLTFKEYKKTILSRAKIATATMLLFTIIFSIICALIKTKTAFSESETLFNLFTWLFVAILVCLMGIVFCWSMYFYYLGIRKKLEKKIKPKSMEEI